MLADSEQPELPYSVELEQAVLGALMVDNSHFERVADALDPRDFYDPLHQRLAAKAIALLAAGTPATPLTLGTALDSDEGLRAVGTQYLQNLAKTALFIPDLRGLCAMLHDRAARRQMVTIANGLAAAARDTQESDAVQIARDAAELLCDVGSPHDESKVQPVGAAAMRSLEDVERALRGEKLPMVPSGLNLLDNKMGGFGAGDLIVVAGRPGMGKSGLGACVTLRAALAGYPVMVFSLEMTREQWATRNICDLDLDSGPHKKPLWYQDFRRGRLDDAQFSRAVGEGRRIDALEHYRIADDDRMAVEEIAGRARAFRARFPRSQLGLIAVDYLQKVPVPYRKDRSREGEVAHVAKNLKSLAKLTGWPVLALAQLNRDTDKRREEDRRPTLGDLRESGQIEAEADYVLFPYRPAYYVEQRRPGSDAGPANWATWWSEYRPVEHNLEIICRKARHGATFEVDLWCEIGANAIRDMNPEMAHANPGLGPSGEVLL